MSGWIGAWGTGGTATVTNLTVTGSEIISVNTSTDALRITQTGTGNALVVEDSANPDSSPFVITADGTVGIGNAIPAATRTVTVSRNITGGPNSTVMRSDGVIQSDVTNAARGFHAINSTVASSFVLTNMYNFYAEQGTIGASSSVTNQYGFFADASLTGATNNYGFYSNIASGTGRYNFYAAGTADNYFAGAVGFGAAAATGTIPIVIGYNLTGGTTAYSVRNSPTILSDVTSNVSVYRAQPFTQAAAFTLGGLIHYDASQGTFGAGSAVTNQYGFIVQANLTGATNNYGFYSAIPAGANRYNFYVAGTADNFFQGPIKSNNTVAGGYFAHSAGTTAMLLGSYNVVKVTPNATATYTTTIAPAGAASSIIVVTNGTTSYTITFGTGFLTTGTLATGTVTAKTFVVNFVSDGTTMIETSRTVAM